MGFPIAAYGRFCRASAGKFARISRCDVVPMMPALILGITVRPRRFELLGQALAMRFSVTAVSGIASSRNSDPTAQIAAGTDQVTKAAPIRGSCVRS